jgi:UDP-glucose 4-epimerase
MTLRGAHVLVTGGAGFIGSHLVDRLIDAGVRAVTVLDDFSLGREANLASALASGIVTIEVGDAADLQRLVSLTDRGGAFDCCFNLAVIPLPASLVKPSETTLANVAMTTAVCEFGRAGGFKRLVQFSSSEVYGTALHVPMDEHHPLCPETPYAASKAATDLIAESYGRTFGMEVVTVRPFNAYGPRQNDASYAGLIPTVVTDVLAGRPVTIHGDGAQTRDYTFVTDIAATAIRAAERDAALGNTYNAGTGREDTVTDIVRLLLESLDVPDWPVVHGPPRPADVRRLYADTARANADLDHTLTISLADGLRLTVEWYLEVLGRRPDPLATTRAGC